MKESFYLFSCIYVNLWFSSRIRQAHKFEFFEDFESVYLCLFVLNSLFLISIFICYENINVNVAICFCHRFKLIDHCKFGFIYFRLLFSVHFGIFNSKLSFLLAIIRMLLLSNVVFPLYRRKEFNHRRKKQWLHGDQPFIWYSRLNWFQLVHSALN